MLAVRRYCLSNDSEGKLDAVVMLVAAVDVGGRKIEIT